MVFGSSYEGFQKKKILEEINQVLKNKDKEAFLRLTEELKSAS
ncbi:IDEAL domain-containing protein [Bacillus megaterium]|nr:IDEAL domain-containing protein [Priestia megaterium]